MQLPLQCMYGALQGLKMKAGGPKTVCESSCRLKPVFSVCFRASVMAGAGSR
ncbi:hypothetical protein LY76DRAFT_589589 [Colletotrichum caudatum]|nr:hypothetical protein LY76DRAFT_589589 [Colletotrichum caudatum]